jgi:hypothetical protein
MNLSFVHQFSPTSRNKLYLLPFGCNEKVLIKELENNQLSVVDVGRELALELSENSKTSRLKFIEELLGKIIEKTAVTIQEINQKAIALHNLGILQEPVFALNVEKIIADISKNIHIIILWSGKYEDTGILSWKSKTNNNFNLDFSAYGIRTINFSYEI